MRAAIELQGLSKRYKEKVAVSPMTLTINQGELFGLLGLNGTGKTTVINMLSGLAKPSAGDALGGIPRGRALAYLTVLGRERLIRHRQI